MKSFFITPSILLVFFIHSMSVSAQVKITGQVDFADAKHAVGANVLLLNDHDSMLVKGNITDAAGNFIFENIKAGSYILEISFSGYKPWTDKIIVEDKALHKAVVKLQSLEKVLNAITVVSKKPLFEQQNDRMVINVKNSITSAGGTALEVLEKSPGVIINRQSNSIGLNGKEGVVVMINGKISRMSSDALIQMLAGMNASNIDKIELITTPPANFDAEGNAGFINIVLISNPNQGFNSNVSLTMGYGKGYTPAGSINFNYRTKKINFFGDYSYIWNNQEQEFGFYRRYTQQGIVTENTTDNLRHPKDGNQSARMGIDVQVSPKTIIGASISGYHSVWKMYAENSLLVLRNSKLDSTVNVTNTELNEWKHLMGNINFTYKLGEEQTITADADYLYYLDNNPNDYINTYYDAMGNLLSSENARSTKYTPLNFFVSKIDYTARLNKKITMEAGMKLSLSKFSNDVAVENNKIGNWITDTSLTARYKLKENIWAAYTAFNIAASDKTTIKMGLRYENTSSNLGSEKQQNIVDRKYGKFFPSVFVTKKIDDNNSINVSYSRRITRPTFKDMAPFVIFVDPYTFFSGNSGLQPALSNIYKTDFIHRNFVLSLSYTKEDHSIANFQPKISADNKQIYAAQNLNYKKTFNISISLPIKVTSWWNMQNNVQGNWQQLNATYVKGPFQIEQKNYQVNSSQNFKLPKRFSLELSGYYQSASLFGASVTKPLGIMNFGAQKNFGKNNNKLRLALNNIFDGGEWRGVTDIQAEGIYTTNRFRFTQRTLKITYSQDFGNNKLKASRNRATASDEEQQRVK